MSPGACCNGSVALLVEHRAVRAGQPGAGRTPGGAWPVQTRQARRAAILKRQFGLDKSLPLQYVIWLAGNDWMKVDADGDGVADSYGTRKGILRGISAFRFARASQP